MVQFPSYSVIKKYSMNSEKQSRFANVNYRPEEWLAPVEKPKDGTTGIPAVDAAIKINRKILVDYKTGCYNNAYFDIFKEQNFDANRNHNQIGIIFIDLNDLKMVNDSLGHEKGDNLIKATVEYLKSAFRKIDVIIRIGGDEFIIVCHNTNEDPDFQVHLTEKAEMVNINSPKSINFAHGVAVFNKHKDRDLDDTKDRADKLMYACKRKMKVEGKGHPFEKTLIARVKRIADKIKRTLEGK